MNVTPAATSPRRSQRLRGQRDTLIGWSLSSPALILLILFLLLPFLMAFVLAFTDQRLVPNATIPTRFVGLRNFTRLFVDETFHRALLNNFIFAAVVVPMQTSFALLLASLINQKLRAINLFRTIYFSPVVTTMVVVAIIWTFLYNPGRGFINAIIQTLSFGHLGPYSWLRDPKLALPAIMVLSIWQGVGFQMVIYLAGLQDIPNYLYEAAQIDGANKLQQFFYVTLPQLRNTTIFVVVTTTILAFKLFTQNWVMVQGGPQNATMTTIIHVYVQGFKQGRIGYASAITVVFFLIVLAISLSQRVFLTEERSV